jgi:tetratricopeptide (TPR) repeat protein
LERAWAWNALGTQGWAGRGDTATAIADYRKALSIVPEHNTWLSALVQWTREYGHAEDSFAAAQRFVKTFPQSRQAQGSVASLKGDFAESARLAALNREAASSPATFDLTNWNLELALASQHDAKAARRALGEPLRVSSLYNRTFSARATVLTLVALGDWQAVLTQEPASEQTMRATQFGWDFDTFFNRNMRPGLALAMAHLGDISGAQALIAATPLDCYTCVRYRGQIASQARQWEQADRWFAKAVQDGPSLPFAYADWGQSLLLRGKPDDAIARFSASNSKGPHFADPLEGWGEALMAKNQSHLALAKFAEADKYAPNWGRLHLKWGEALVYAGKKDQAKAQFAHAAQLDLTPAEKAERRGIHE